MTADEHGRGGAAPPGDARWARGRETMDRAYGPGFSDRYPAPEQLTPFLQHTVGTLFGEIWSRDGLPLRDRRLLVLGAVSMLGRADLVQVQVLGGLRAGDFTREQLQEAVLQLAPYCGWPNATALEAGVRAALAAFATGSADPPERPDPAPAGPRSPEAGAPWPPSPSSTPSPPPSTTPGGGAPTTNGGR